MPHFDGATGRVYYRHWSVPSPRAAVVFLHGFGEHSGLYHRYAAALGERGIELWALDEIGHGLTAGERGNVGSLTALTTNASTLVDLARTASPGLPIVLSGHSLGSLVATQLALDGSDRFAGLVVSGALLTPLEWLQEALTGASGNESFDLDPAALSSDPFYLDELANDPLAFASADVVTVFGEVFPPAWERFEAELPALTLPILAVHGVNDQIAPLDGVTVWSDRLPSLRVVPIEDAGHDVLNEVEHRHVARTIAEFVLETSGARADT